MEQRTIQTQESAERIDALLARSLPGLTRSAAQRLLAQGAVTKDGAPVKKNYKTAPGDTFVVTLPDAAPSELVAQDLPLDVVYEDADLIVVNKPRGMVVHPAPGHEDGTLVNALLAHCGESLSGVGGERRPGIVHRIDKDTSGLLVAAKNDFAHLALSAQLADHTMARTYEAVVCGNLRDDAGTVDAPIGRHPTDRKRMAVTQKNARRAVTHWSVIARYNGYTHIRCELETGRTHQIRVHMAHIGHPLLGDLVYGHKRPEKGLSGQCLHARALRFIHPRTGELVTFTCPLPEYFQDVLARLGTPIGGLERSIFMRRADREITNFDELIAVMRGCDVCRLALHDEPYPYILPLNFGLEADGGTVRLYFHGADTGTKYDLIARNPNASFEMDRGHGLILDDEHGNCTMTYESVIGQGRITVVPDSGKEHALRVLMAQYRAPDFPFSTAVIPRTTVLCLTVEHMTGKRRVKKHG